MEKCIKRTDDIQLQSSYYERIGDQLCEDENEFYFAAAEAYEKAVCIHYQIEIEITYYIKVILRCTIVTIICETTLSTIIAKYCKMLFGCK
jgi:hypothetical protein